MSDNTKNLPLPKGWIRTFSNSQKRYYYSHKDTKHTQWHFPTASEAADPWMAKRRAEENQEKERKRATTTTMTTTMDPAASSKRPRTSTDPTPRTKKLPTPTLPSTSSKTGDDIDSLLALADTTNVAIIVPYRDLHQEQRRAAHMAQFVPHMIQFLTKLQTARKVSDFHIYIVEQSNDGRKFNRGKLLNIGFDWARRKQQQQQKQKQKQKQQHDVFIFHDVDLLPQDDLAAAYATFPKTPYHIARVWDRYSNNPKYFGGIVSFSSSDFKRINGYPNTFWGWGGEDDELQLRCQAIGLSWDWPRNLSTTSTSTSTTTNSTNQQGNKTLIVDLEQMTLQDKLQFLRQHKEWKCMVKWEALEEHAQTWRQNGLADLQYKVLDTQALDGKGKATKITVDVQLNNNHWANDKCGLDYMGGDWNQHNK